MIPGIETFHTRESWQDPKYPVFGPLDDPTNNRMAVIHYTAADDLIDGDPGEHAEDLPAYMRAMNKSYWVNRGYALGYLFAVDWLGGVWQIRGWEYQSAANKGENETTWPILMLVDGDDPATPEAVRSVRAIVAEADRRAGRPQSIVGHKDIGATACPGAGLYAQVKAGVFTPQPDPIVPPVVPPPSSSEVDMFIAIINNGSGPVAETWTVCDGTQLSHITNGHAAEVYINAGLPQVRIAGADQLAGFLASVKTMNACPPEWVGTGWEAAWNKNK